MVSGFWDVGSWAWERLPEILILRKGSMYLNKVETLAPKVPIEGLYLKARVYTILMSTWTLRPGVWG